MMIKSAILRNAVLLAASLCLIGTSSAANRCKVTGPTGTPLNVRDHDKRIVGTLTNGMITQVLRDGSDDSGKPWAYVATPGGREIGWVYREFISRH
jgi:hypothetical protein